MSTIRDMTAGDVEGLLQLYNELVSHLPNYRVAELAEFGEALECSSRYGELANARLVVGEVDGQLVGFAHVATGSFEDIHEREQSGGVIHFLGYRPGHRVVGQGLLAAAEDHARQYGMSEMWAFQADMGYGFNHLGFGNATDRMGHVGALFQANGYGVNEEFVWLRWDDYSIAEPEPPGDEYEVVLSEAGARGLTLDLRLNGEESGGCWAFPKDAYDGTGKWLYTKGLAVYDDEGKGRGWGRYLLLRMLWEGQRLGYRRSLVQTLRDNHTAQLLYTNVGYQVCDIARGYWKEL